MACYRLPTRQASQVRSYNTKTCTTASQDEHIFIQQPALLPDQAHWASRFGGSRPAQLDRSHLR